MWPTMLTIKVGKKVVKMMLNSRLWIVTWWTTLQKKSKEECGNWVVLKKIIEVHLNSYTPLLQPLHHPNFLDGELKELNWSFMFL